MRSLDENTTLQSPTFGYASAAPAHHMQAADVDDSEQGYCSEQGATTPLPVASDRYLEREVIGEGGMSLVVRAFDKELGREVALKLLRPDLRARDRRATSLIMEARVTASLEHPNIIPVYELGTNGRGDPFFAMRLVNGETLEQTLDWAGRARLAGRLLAALLRIYEKVCDAVAFAHSRGVVHCDLKPSNIMTSDFEQVYVLDWGVARTNGRFGVPGDAPAASSRVVRSWVGTPRYMAPEQLWGPRDAVDERTDVFALGATLYQVLTGWPPHDPRLLPDLAIGKAKVFIPAPEHVVEGGVPRELSRIAMKAMAYDPCDRHGSVEMLKQEIEAYSRRWLG
jgi:eukaryotic-like serine/threonine-protein kinase